MKIRLGFVSNSSSSSFIVFGSNIDKNINLEDEIYIIGENGKTEYGWEYENTSDFDSKVNFAAMQTMYVDNEKWYKMLKEILKEETGCTDVKNIISFEWPVPDGFTGGYIDHQSSSCEGENTEIFASKENLKLFLFSGQSYIEGGANNWSSISNK